MLNFPKRLLLSIFESALRRPKLTLLIALLISLAGISGIGRLRTLLKIEDVLERGSQQAQAMRELSKDFRVGNTVAAFVSPPIGRESFTPQELCTIRKWLSGQRLYRSDLIRSVSTFDLRTPVHPDGEETASFTIPFSSCAAMAPTLLSP